MKSREDLLDELDEEWDKHKWIQVIFEFARLFVLLIILANAIEAWLR